MTAVYSFFFYSFLNIVRFTPAFLYFPLTRVALRIFYALNHKAQRHALESLTLAYGVRIGSDEKKRLARASFLNLADGLAGFIFTIGRPLRSKKNFEFDGIEKLAIALSSGQGAVVGVAHFGPFVWMLFRFIAEGYRVSVVAKPPRGEFLREKFRDSFQHTGGLNVILSTPVRTCIVESLQALKSGQLLFMPVDQNYGAAGRIFVRFFGRMAATAPGPAVYAAKTGAPLFMAFAVPTVNDQFKIRIEGPIKLDNTGDERRDLVTNTQRFTSVVEEYVRDYPEQWAWLHRRWKCEPRENELKGE